MAGKGIFSKHLTVKGWRYKRERGVNREGTHSHSLRILMAGSLKRRREKNMAILKNFIQKQKGKE